VRSSSSAGARRSPRWLSDLAAAEIRAELSSELCADASRKPPELGVFAHFLQTVIHSQERRKTSTLIGDFLRLAVDWTGSQWLLEPKGFHSGLVLLTTRFRNRAVHIDELGREDYLGCRELVMGSEGLLWKLLVATECHK
jgi:hypothetical protein